MSVDIAQRRPVSLVFRPWLLAWVGAVAAITLLGVYGEDWGLSWLTSYPSDWVVPIADYISDFMKWLINDLDFYFFSFKDFTRGISWLLNGPLWLANHLLASGFEIEFGEDQSFTIPPLSWVAMIGALAYFAYRIKDWGLALLVALCFLYLAVFGQWESAMITLSSIIVAVPIGVVGGLMLGIFCYRSRWIEKMVGPILDLMQTVPVFAYLVPILFLFGFGPVAAMAATIIYAMPPMVRITMLALRQVPEEIVEVGRMAGTTRRQMTWKILIPSAAPSLMVGVNQVIMLSLNMVIIASMIGAGGLGRDVLVALRRLAIGEGLEAGVAITLLAIAMDRLSQAMARQGEPKHKSETGWRRYKVTLGVVAGLSIATGIGLLVPSLGAYPQEWTITTSPFWDELVRFINISMFDIFEAIKNFFLLNLLIPFKRFLLAVPWIGIVGLLALGGWRLGGWRLAGLAVALSGAIAITGQWEKAMITIYLCGISVVVASLIGMPIGIMAARNPRLYKPVFVFIDTIQTMPSFVYLIPVVMLFRNGDFAAMIAVVLYAIPPAVRYTAHGIKRVPPALVEAGITSGCTSRQLLWRVQLPVAMPEIMLGLNQTIMFALSMLVITALVGTRDLGQEVYAALAKAETGRGIVAGLAVAFIAIIADRMIGAWAKKRKRELGLVG